MENITLQKTVNQIVSAYMALDAAKEDFNYVVESALDAYAETEPGLTKTDRKNIKKIAKSMAGGKKKDVQDEADSLKELVDSIG